MTSELKRLIDDQGQPGYLREMILQARMEEGPEYDLQAGLNRHRALVASGAPMPDWMHPSIESSVRSGDLAMRLVGIATVPMVIGGAMWGVWSMLGQPASPKTAAAPAAVISAPAESSAATADKGYKTTPSVKASTGETDARPVVRLRDTLVVQAAPSERPAASQSQRSTEAKKSTTRSTAGSTRQENRGPDGRDKAALPTAVPVAPEATVAVASNQVSSAPAPLASALAPQQPTPSALPSSDSILRREMALLAQARRYTESRPLAALELAQDKELKTGLLNEEWDQVYLLSLLKLGRVQEARQSAQRFQSRYPHSAFNERIRKQLSSSAQ